MQLHGWLQENYTLFVSFACNILLRKAKKIKYKLKIVKKNKKIRKGLAALFIFFNGSIVDL